MGTHETKEGMSILCVAETLPLKSSTVIVYCDVQYDQGLFVWLQVLSELTPCGITVDEHWPVIGQFSSVGSLGPTSNSWLCTEWLHSLSAVKRAGKSSVMHKYPNLQLV